MLLIVVLSKYDGFRFYHKYATNLSMCTGWVRWKDKGDIYEVVHEANTNNRRWRWSGHAIWIRLILFSQICKIVTKALRQPSPTWQFRPTRLSNECDKRRSWKNERDVDDAVRFLTSLTCICVKRLAITSSSHFNNKWYSRRQCDEVKWGNTVSTDDAKQATTGKDIAETREADKETRVDK